MEKLTCYLCHKPKATLYCGACTEAICKGCAQFLNDDTFSFLARIPASLKHTTYCEPCFHNTVEPELAAYNRILERAKNIMVFSKTQSKETRLIKRIEDPVKVIDCPDHDETILRLAFFAAQANYNAIVDVELVSEKVKNGSYQTSKWAGVAIPAQVNDAKLLKDRSSWSDPN
ncbi:MAG: hypothetical protein H7061_10020 [Bdellovibrionaceae bacterium]|nr:hypothetical protein [Bdellovibrio sp.]